jgi:hypothetical protein
MLAPERSYKHLSGLAHDIAHHAQSGLSYLHPHLGKACAVAGIESVEVDLTSWLPYPRGVPFRLPLFRALGALRRTFVRLMKGNGYKWGDVTSVILVFSFPRRPIQPWLCDVEARITAANGKTFSKLVAWDPAFLPAQFEVRAT